MKIKGQRFEQQSRYLIERWPKLSAETQERIYKTVMAVVRQSQGVATPEDLKLIADLNRIAGGKKVRQKARGKAQL